MATFHFELVSPENLLFSGEVDQVDVPGAEGTFGVLAQHAPVVSMLRPGVMRVIKDGAILRFMVLGGFAEVSPAGLTVLADIASSAEEVDAARLDAYIKELEETIAQMEQGSALDREITRLDHVKAVQAELASAAANVHAPAH